MPDPEPFAGCFEGDEHLFALRVYFEDTDMGGVVYHANYLRWFERARTDMLGLLGLDQRSTYEAGEGVFAIAEVNIRYLAPARLNDAVLVRTRATELGGSSARLFQRAFVGERCITEATIRVVFVGPDLKAIRIPPAWREAFASRVLSLTPAESPE